MQGGENAPACLSLAGVLPRSIPGVFLVLFSLQVIYLLLKCSLFCKHS